MVTTQHPLTRQRVSALALAAVVTLGMGGCALIEPTGNVEPPTVMESCALGKTWNLDTAVLAEQLRKDFELRSINVKDVTAEGSQSLTWSQLGDASLQSDYTVVATVTSGGKDVVVTQQHKGTAGGKAYINSDVAIPRNWNATALEVTTATTVNGSAVEDTPIPITRIDIDDSVGIELTCDGGTMTTHGRGSDITLTWTS